MRRDEFLQYAKPEMGEDEIRDVADTIKSGWITKGPRTAEFEEKFARFVGAKYAVAVNSCTAALHTALVCRGIKSGDEVITTPFTFAATVNVILHCGAKPVLVDIDPRTYTIDPEKIEEKITSRTKAIIPVHYAGQACNMDEIMDIAKRHNLFVLEDAAHAVYTKYKDSLVGGIGDATAFSFYATKNLATGEGGMLTTNDKELAERARVVSLHGMSRHAWNRYSKSGSWYYEIEYPGFKYNMTDIQAALGLNQLAKLESMQAAREKYANMYNDAFAGVDEIIEPFNAPYSRHAWHLYPVQIDDGMLSIGRDEFIEELGRWNIGTSVHFIPVHMHPYYRDMLGFQKGEYPVTEKVYSRILSLPLYPGMSEEDVKYVIEAVNETVDKFKAKI
ncbi:dTDP-4-amino-4,6-dideoxygalactose transaminase [Peptoclostridium litorale DSM 5388]|uniref:Spore coat polysaccharide biosynthesis protein SpsC n=1 Tax=Peptoclostridium litorale DSM 5388 TaxID=1121324 RepID=A0A069REM5_PEPLI|nr:DegT/DnrJ/EryC1/StrS aminotransferase family protein [Peptoclostridium litorale]KDR94625.1 spore coat polysaccharide biosynthesis protein SpsC [Peptoclostridium litorale DSM 5388]SIO30652.1 dTDP-4-amino-4,6-dideoxygalactose transaminase [Peptoclostridium litorale DSM 5388]